MPANYTPTQLLARLNENLPLLIFLTYPKLYRKALSYTSGVSGNYLAPLSQAEYMDDPDTHRADWAVMDQHYQAYYDTHLIMKDSASLSSYDLPVYYPESHDIEEPHVEVLRYIGLPEAVWYFTEDTQARFWINLDMEFRSAKAQLDTVAALQELQTLLVELNCADRNNLTQQQRVQLVLDEVTEATHWQLASYWPSRPKAAVTPLPEEQHQALVAAFTKVVIALGKRHQCN